MLRCAQRLGKSRSIFPFSKAQRTQTSLDTNHNEEDYFKLLLREYPNIASLGKETILTSRHAIFQKSYQNIKQDQK